MLESVIRIFDAALVIVGTPLIVAGIVGILYTVLGEKGSGDDEIKSKR